MESLEQELNSRIFVHKVALVGGALMHDYINEEKAKKGIALPDFIISQNADEYSSKIIQEALKTGTFEELYNKIWEQVKDVLPEDTIVI